MGSKFIATINHIPSRAMEALIVALIRFSLKASRAFDDAAHAMFCGDQAASHYQYEYPPTAALRDWIRGFREGWMKPWNE